MNINSCHKLCQQITEGIQTAKVWLFYHAAVLTALHAAQVLPSHSVHVHALARL